LRQALKIDRFLSSSRLSDGQMDETIYVCDISLRLLFFGIFFSSANLAVTNFSDVYNYCTTSRPQTANRTKTTSSGANFAGEELYLRVNDFLKKHMKSLLKVRRRLSPCFPFFSLASQIWFCPFVPMNGQTIFHTNQCVDRDIPSSHIMPGESLWFSCF
jgi:hypothetical protein